jgi:hypothetical protein
MIPAEIMGRGKQEAREEDQGCSPYDEVWYAIPSIPGFQMSSELRIRRPRRRFDQVSRCKGEWFYPALTLCGSSHRQYLTFKDSGGGKVRCYYLHEVVAELAYGSRPEGAFVCHRDDVQTTNYPSNLYYGSRKSNARDAHRNGNVALGERCGSSKLNPTKVREIRSWVREGWPMSKVAKLYGVSDGTVLNIMKGRTWSHVEDEDDDFLPESVARLAASNIMPESGEA